ncbi:hypothetical protein HMI54_003267 [Coelomomyces lativittatus]|nr:hypothetical protein HMI56_002496 [Coelomomyces lativittatus]KAJ1508382.1 hypothetical protein HMI54_003267 [Coelomomyces lativittatus]KAJ1512308.1 hypothetical protein HMI55_006278 [Coelomomyces lativittatus]
MISGEETIFQSSVPADDYHNGQLHKRDALTKRFPQIDSIIHKVDGKLSRFRSEFEKVIVQKIQKAKEGCNNIPDCRQAENVSKEQMVEAYDKKLLDLDIKWNIYNEKMKKFREQAQKIRLSKLKKCENALKSLKSTRKQ